MKQVFTHLPQQRENGSNSLSKIKGLFLTPAYWILAHAYSTPGLFIHRYVTQVALKLILRRRPHKEFIEQILFFPMDSFRYFELGFLWGLIAREPIGHLLDLSSPRLLPTLILERLTVSSAVFVNPDIRDLAATKKLMKELELDKNCKFSESLVDNLDHPEATFDVITSVSVIEHIPEYGDLRAVKKLWSLLKPGGKLYLSVPCAAEATEEYIDYDEYGILRPDKDGFVFGQRFYDEKLLQRRIFSVTGPPSQSAIYGEKREGIFAENRERKLSNSDYPYWREAYMMGKDYAYFKSIDELPAWGVIAMEFQKN